MEKVILISIDGMRPDAFLACGNPYAEELRRISAHTLDAVTVMPSLTLPCHMSMFHGVTPNTVSKQLARTREKLRAYLAERGYTV